MKIELDESSIYFRLYDTNNHRECKTLTYTFSIAANHLVGDILNRNMIQISTEILLNSPSPAKPQLSEIRGFLGTPLVVRVPGRVIEDNESRAEWSEFSRLGDDKRKERPLAVRAEASECSERSERSDHVSAGIRSNGASNLYIFWVDF